MDTSWLTMLIPTVPAWELLVRGTLTFLGLLFLLRIVGRREAGLPGDVIDPAQGQPEVALGHCPRMRGKVGGIGGVEQVGMARPAAVMGEARDGGDAELAQAFVDFVGILGGNIIASVYLKLPSSLYWQTVWEQVASDGFTFRYIPNDFIQGLVKPFVFGGIISITACYNGLNVRERIESIYSKEGFDAIPGQDLSSWSDSLERAIARFPIAGVGSSPVRSR